MLFFEKSLKLLEWNGRLYSITPEKIPVCGNRQTPEEKCLPKMWVKEIEFLNEDAFSGLITYPTITIIENSDFSADTLVTYRDGG